MIKFKITSERMEEALDILEYIGVSGKNLGTIVRVAPRFVIGDDGEYIVKVISDEDGDIKTFDGYMEALERMSRIPAKRLNKIVSEFAEAAQNIVNPPSGADSNKPSDSA